jgi:hypothetical protein
MADVFRRAASSDIAAYAFVVDAKDDSAAAFYAHHGVCATVENPLFLYLPLATVKDLVKSP